MRRVEVVATALLAIGGLTALTVLIPRYVLDSPAVAGLSPRFMPYLAAGLATAAALKLLGSALLRGRTGVRAEPLTLEPLQFVLVATFVLGGSYVLMSRLGYLVGAAALVAGMLAVARARPLTIVVTAAAAPVALWLTFSRLLSTPLP